MLDVLLKNQQWKKFVPFLLVLTLFFIPISSSIKSIFIVLSALAILATPTYNNTLSFVLTQDWCKAAILFFLIALMACIWSPADYHARLLFIGKYSKLLFLPIFVLGFQNPTMRRLGIHAFILAMIVTCFLSVFYQLHHIESERLFHDHISTGCMMALAAFFSGVFAIQQVGLKRVLFLSMTLLFTYQVIFVNTGRIGYISYFVLMILFLAQNLPRKNLMTGVLSFCVLFFFLGYQSPSLQERIHKTMFEWSQYQHGEKVTSVGMRIVFHNHAKAMFLSSPWTGHGTGSFSHFYQKVNTAADYSNVMEPHSQYWLVASEFGLLGFVILLYFFITLLSSAFRMDEMKPIMLGMLACFFLSNFSDSQLLHSDMGYLFIVVSALCLGERLAYLKTEASPILEPQQAAMLKAATP